MKREIRPAERVGPYDIVVARVGETAVVEVPEIPDALANMRAAGFELSIVYYDREDTTPW